jgi:hypothetical protein
MAEGFQEQEGFNQQRLQGRWEVVRLLAWEGPAEQRDWGPLQVGQEKDGTEYLLPTHTHTHTHTHTQTHTETHTHICDCRGVKLVQK